MKYFVHTNQMLLFAKLFSSHHYLTSLEQAKLSVGNWAWTNFHIFCFTAQNKSNHNIYQFHTERNLGILPVGLEWFIQVAAYSSPDSKVHGADMGPTLVLSAPDGAHDGPINLAIRE